MELSEWEAYEREYGPVNDRWRDEVLAQLHELTQQQMRLLGAAHFTDKKHRKNPVPEPKRVPRPWVIHEDDEEDQDPKDYTEEIPDSFWEEDPEDEEGEE